MKPFVCSSSIGSPLNQARRRLWAAKFMLGSANQEPHRYTKSLWMSRINTYRAELRKVAHEVRAGQ